MTTEFEMREPEPNQQPSQPEPNQQPGQPESTDTPAETKAKRSLIRTVYRLMQEGMTAPDIMFHLGLKPSRLKRILNSRSMQDIRQLENDTANMATKMLVLKKALPVIHSLGSMSIDNTESGRKACVDLLNQLNLNYPPAAKTMVRASFWD